MKQFKDVIKEINRTLTQIIIFENLTNTTLVFLAFYFIFSIFDINPIFAAIPSGLYLSYYTWASFTTSKHLLVENKYAPLREKLRTAADNMDVDNPIVEELEYEVTTEMKNVGLSMFLNPRTLSYKIFAVMVLSFMIIFAATMDLRIIELARQAAPDIFEGPKGVGNLAAVKLNTSDDIYGKNDVAKLGDDELSIKIKPVDFKINVREEGDAEQREFETVFPQEVTVKETTSYEEDIPIEQQELFKNYFNNLAA